MSASDLRQRAIARLSAAMSAEGLYEAGRYEDVGPNDASVTIVEYGDPLDGRAFVVFADGRLEETDR